MSLTEYAASAASRAFFYPSVLYNTLRCQLQTDWVWYSEVVEHVWLGALPFESTLTELREQGIRAVVTLNQGFELFVSPQQCVDLGFAHLHLPTTDFLFAPPNEELHRGVDFIIGHTKRGEGVYVHCKAGRGRSTTLVLCFLIREQGMTPQQAWDLVRAKRPQVCLSSGQWAAVEAFAASCGWVKPTASSSGDADSGSSSSSGSVAGLAAAAEGVGEVCGEAAAVEQAGAACCDDVRAAGAGGSVGAGAGSGNSVAVTVAASSATMIGHVETAKAGADCAKS